MISIEALRLVAAGKYTERDCFRDLITTVAASLWYYKLYPLSHGKERDAELCEEFRERLFDSRDGRDTSFNSFKTLCREFNLYYRVISLRSPEDAPFFQSAANTALGLAWDENRRFFEAA